MKIYKLNDCDWYMAPTLEDAIQHAMEYTGLPREEVLDHDDESSIRPLNDEELDRLKYVDDMAYDEDGRSKTVTRSFREELSRRVASNPQPQLFASTEY